LKYQTEQTSWLKDKALYLEAQIAAKLTEIEEIKRHQDISSQEIERCNTKIGELKMCAEEYMQELQRKQLEINQSKASIERCQEELKMSKAAHEKTLAVVNEGRTLIAKLQNELKNLQDKLKNFHKNDESFEKTLVDVLDQNQQLSKTNDKLIKIISLQKFNYDNILEHFYKKYGEIYRRYSPMEEYELKAVDTGSDETVSPCGDRVLDKLYMECKSHFETLKRLKQQFNELNDQQSANATS